MNPLLREIRYTPLLWMLIFVPAVLIAARIVPAAHTLLFVLAVLAIVPLAALLSHATEAVSEKTGDAIGVAPAAVSELDLARDEVMAQNFSAALAILLIVAYGLGLLFSLKTHKELFASEDHGETEEAKWPINLAVGTLLVVTVLVALVSEIFVESVQQAAATLGMSPAFVGFIIVALVGAAAEMAVAFSAARKNRLDMSVSIALGSASQIALFVAPVLVLLSYVVGPKPMDLQFGRVR